MSRFDWNTVRDARAEKLPEGVHEVEIVEVVYTGRDGPLTSQAGDPQIRIVMRDSHQREAIETCTLAGRAVFKLAQFLEAIGCDFDKLAKYRPEDFAASDVADPILVGRRLTVELKPYMAKNGKTYTGVTPLPAAPKPKPATDDLPF